MRPVKGVTKEIIMEPEVSDDKLARGTIIKMGEEHAAEVSLIHANALASDFLPSMGVDFLTELYKGIITSGQGIGFVHVADEKVVGFILAAKDTKKLFYGALMKRGLILAAIGLKKVIRRPSLIPKIAQTILYPKTDDIKSELLVIAVDGAYKHKHVGRELIEALNSVFIQEGVSEYKVVVYKDNEKANGFYRAVGFHLDRSSRLYGKECNIYKYCLPKRV